MAGLAPAFFTRARVWLRALALAALLAGCATPIPKVMVLESDSEGAAKRAPIVWPAPPQVPRYVWAGQLLGEVNFKAVEKKQFDALDTFRWLVGLVLGDDKPVMLHRPQTGVVDAAGRTYVTDAGKASVFVFDRIAGELLVWGKAEGLKDFISPVGIAVGPGGDILVSTPWPYTPMYTEMKDRIRVFDYSKYNLVTPIIEPMQMSLEEVTQALAKCYMKFYSHKMLEIAGMEEGFKKDYLMSAMRLMMKEQCSAFRMTGMKMPDLGAFFPMQAVA